MEQVAKGLHHAAPQVRRETVEVLADSGSGAAVAVLFDSYSAIGPRAEDALVRLGAGAVSYLEPLLSMEKLSEEKKAVALRVLSRIPGEQSRLALRRIAADLRVSSGLRLYAGKTVASGAGELTKVLRDQQEPVHVRLAAANLLAEHQDSSGTAALIEVLADGREEASLRRECARHLTGNSTPTIAQALAKQLRNPDNPADLRMACLPGVAMSGADEVVELLHGILDENPAEKFLRGEEHLIELRVQVVRALARFSGEQVLPALRTALHDPCTESHHKTHRPQFHGDEDYESEEFVHPVREAAAEVLRTIGGHEATSLLHAHAEYLERQGHMRRFD